MNEMSANTKMTCSRAIILPGFRTPHGAAHSTSFHHHRRRHRRRLLHNLVLLPVILLQTTNTTHINYPAQARTHDRTHAPALLLLLLLLMHALEVDLAEVDLEVDIVVRRRRSRRRGPVVAKAWTGSLFFFTAAASGLPVLLFSGAKPTDCSTFAASAPSVGDGNVLLLLLPRTFFGNPNPNPNPVSEYW